MPVVWHADEPSETPEPPIAEWPATARLVFAAGHYSVQCAYPGKNVVLREGLDTGAIRIVLGGSSSTTLFEALAYAAGTFIKSREIRVCFLFRLPRQLYPARQ